MHPLAQYFDTIWCADDGPGKPHPFMCQAAMNALGVEAESALMIGDSIFDNGCFSKTASTPRRDLPVAIACSQPCLASISSKSTAPSYKGS
ncbi:MAG: HAD-IA family hydrolase [Pseudomonadota bacterium]